MVKHLVLVGVAALTLGIVVGCKPGGSGKVAGGSADRARVEGAVAKVFPALVRIYVVGKSHGAGREQKRMSAGSGTIISPDGYVLTNHHVAGKAKYLRVTLSNRDEAEAELIGTDAMSDLAIIKLKPETMRSPVKTFTYAKFGDSDALEVGDAVMAMGSPGALSQSVTRGIVSNTQMILPGGGTRLDGERVGSIVRWIAHDSQIFHGNSGGPLVNLDGEVIGVNEIGVAALGGAIPGNLAKYVANELIKHGKVRRSSVGLEVRPLLRSSGLNSGVLVNGVVPGSPAQKAGIKPGDIIAEYDGKSVRVRWGEELPEFNRLVLETPVGKKVVIKYVRKGQVNTAEMVTVSRGHARGKDHEVRSWGATMREFTRISARESKRKNTAGVQISSIRPGGPCGQAKPKIGVGDVIVKVGDKEVKTLAELRKVSAEITKGKDVGVPTVITYERKTMRLMTAVKIGPEEKENRSPEVRKAWFPAAVQVFTRDLAAAMKLIGTKGVLIAQVFPVSAAEKAGFKVGDILTHVDNQPIDASQPEDGRVFPTMIRRYKIGTEAEISVLRDGKKSRIKIKLPKAPVPVREMKRYKDLEFEFTGRDVAYMDKTSRKWKQSQKGVYVEAVVPGSWASLARMGVGDLLLKVNGKPVENVDQFKKVMLALSKSKPRYVVFFVRRGVHSRYLELEPDWESK